MAGRGAVDNLKAMLKVWPGMAAAPIVKAPAEGEPRDARRTLAAWAAYVVELRGREGRRDPSEEGRARVHIEHDPVGALYLEEVSPREVRAWLSRRLESVSASRGRFEGKRMRRPLARSTIQNALNLLRVILEEGVIAGRLDVNPARGISLPRYRSRYEDRSRAREARALTGDELAKLLGAELDYELKARVLVTLDVGWRLGEMAGLRVGDVDLRGGRAVVSIRRQAGERPTKSGKPRRVEVGRLAGRVFLEWLEMRAAGLAGAALLGAEVFPGAAWSKRLAKAARRAGLGRAVTWHDLRHTSAVGWAHGWWGEPALSVREIQRRLGHASVTTTEGYLREKA